MTTTTAEVTITGEIKSIRFRNSEGWSVFSLVGVAMGLTGTLAAMIDVGTNVTCTGTVVGSKFGDQLKCSTIIPEAPDVNSEEGVIKLLKRLPGIGPAKARAAVTEHGAAGAWELARTDPGAIGVGDTALQEAMDLSNSMVGSYKATVYMLSIGLTDNQAGKVYKIHGNSSIQIISEKPYILTDIDGFGFITVDKIALKAGIGAGSQARIQACIKYVVDDSALADGHIWRWGRDLVEIVLATLTDTAAAMEVPMLGMPDYEEIRKCVYFLAAEGVLVVDDGKVFSTKLLEAEKMILELVGR